MFPKDNIYFWMRKKIKPNKPKHKQTNDRIANILKVWILFFLLFACLLVCLFVYFGIFSVTGIVEGFLIIPKHLKNVLCQCFHQKEIIAYNTICNKITGFVPVCWKVSFSWTNIKTPAL